jgi:hypothetical protein
VNNETKNNQETKKKVKTDHCLRVFEGYVPVSLPASLPAPLPLAIFEN